MTVFLRAIALSIVLFVWPGSGFAQDLPPNLRDIASQLGKKRSTTVTFASAGPTTAAACGLAPFNVTLSRGSRSFTHAVLSEPGDKAMRKTIFVVTAGLASDADGSPRAYHPEDPTGSGTCTLTPGRDGALVPSGPACALDSFADGGIAVFKGTSQLKDSGLKEDWLQFWSLIRERKLASFDLAQVLGASFGYHYYGFYWKQKDMTAIFKDENVQRTADGYPCTRGAGSRYAGYFVAATTLRHATDHAGADVERPSVFALASADASAADRTPAPVAPALPLAPAAPVVQQNTCNNPQMANTQGCKLNTKLNAAANNVNNTANAIAAPVNAASNAAKQIGAAFGGLFQKPAPAPAAPTAPPQTGQ